jgi:hypothetical protein
MGQRHHNAIGIAGGACNPLAISNAIARGCHEIMDNPAGYAGTDAITSDPAIKLMTSQLAYITGVWSGVSNFSKGADFRDCLTACRNEVASEPTKSDLMHEAAEARGVPVVDIRMIQFDGADLSGFPTIDP